MVIMQLQQYRERYKLNYIISQVICISSNKGQKLHKYRLSIAHVFMLLDKCV